MNTKTGHIITIPAHLLPFMFDDLRMDDIHETNGKGKKNRLHVQGYRFNDDMEIDQISWQTGNASMTTVYEDVAPDTELTVWVPSIPAALATELA